MFAIDIVVASPCDHRVIAKSGNHDVIISSLTRKQRIAVVDHIAVFVTGVVHVDHIIAVCTIYDAIRAGRTCRGVDDIGVIDSHIINRAMKVLAVFAIIGFTRTDGKVLVVVVADIHREAGLVRIGLIGCTCGQVFDDKGRARGFVP